MTDILYHAWPEDLDPETYAGPSNRDLRKTQCYRRILEIKSKRDKMISRLTPKRRSASLKKIRHWMLYIREEIESLPRSRRRSVDAATRYVYRMHQETT